MKNKLLVGLTVLTLGFGAKEAYAKGIQPMNQVNSKTNYTIDVQDKNYNNINRIDNETWFKTKLEYRKNEVKDYLDNGVITKAEYDNWMKKFDEMDKYHKENGYETVGSNHCGLGYGIEFRDEFGPAGVNGRGMCGGGYNRGYDRNYNDSYRGHSNRHGGYGRSHHNRAY